MSDTEKIRAAVFARTASGETLYARDAVINVIADGSPDTVISTGQWATIHHLVDWIDKANGRTPHEVAMRILKVTEEAGEVASAYIGMTGQNPRKGVTHTAEDVADELCDVILAAAVALVSVTGGEAEQVLSAKLAKVAERAAKVEARDAGLLLGQGA